MSAIVKACRPGADKRTRVASRHAATDVPARSSAGHWPLDPHQLLLLQRLAGNRATTALVMSQRSSAPSTTVQRHDSYEHELLGDTQPKDVANVVGGLKDKAHAVRDEFKRTMFFRRDPGADPRDSFPNVRWIRLGNSKLWVSSGELSALADYLPNPDTIDNLSREAIVPVLQRMRQDIATALEAFVPAPADSSFAGAAENRTWTKPLPSNVQQVEALDAATADLGNNRQKALLARNACHFPPFSWERWSLYHNEARKQAAAWYAIGQGASGTPSGMNEHERLAWVNSSYSNHFLQDSFAAGHLINKTLVMQWFLEYNQNLSWTESASFGLPRDDVAKHMTEAAQPDISGRHLYDEGPRLHTTASEDREVGTGEADPQTVEERRKGTGRLSGSGVRQWGRGRALAYTEYSEFLNTAYLGLAANEAHDELNKIGLTVANARGDRFRVGGDTTLLSKSDERGLEVLLEANQWADKAIDDLIRTGTTTVSTEFIFSLFPTKVEVGGDLIPLEKWNDTELKRLCWKVIFPRMVSWSHTDRYKYAIVRAQGPRLVDSPSGALGGDVMDLPSR